MSRIHKDLAIDEITAFRTFMETKIDYPPHQQKTVACWVSKQDLLLMLEEIKIKEEDGCNGVRFYFGLRRELDETFNSLVMTGTVFNEEKQINQDFLGENGDHIYEFTTPCPDTCDTTSFLFNLMLA
jgi:hypothetical protein